MKFYELEVGQKFFGLDEDFNRISEFMRIHTNCLFNDEEFNAICIEGSEIGKVYTFVDDEEVTPFAE